MSATLPPDLVWAQEQARWRDHHLNHLVASLARLEAAVARGAPGLDRLADHGASVLTVLNHARQARELHDRLIALLLALDPWPVRWGYGAEWAELLRFGVEVAEAQGDRLRRAALLCALAGCYAGSGQLNAAQTAARAAFEAALQVGAREPLVNALDIAVATALRQGETAGAQALLDRVADLVAATDWAELPAMARVCFSHARTLRRLGRLEEALSWADRAVHLVEGTAPEKRDAGLLADAYNVRGVMYWAIVRYAEAARDLERAWTGYRALGDQSGAIRAAGTLGLVYWSQGELERAARLFAEAIHQAEACNDHLQIAINIGNQGLVELCRRRFRPALACFERQLALATEHGDPHEATRALGNRGIVRLHRQEYGAAMADLKSEQRFAEKSGLSEGLICNYVTQVRCLAALGRPAEALALAQKATALARQTRSAALLIIALRCLAEQVAPAEARPALEEALALARESGRRLDEAACLLALSALAEGPEQTRLWRDGSRLLAAIGTRAWLRGHSPRNPPQIVLIA